MTCSRCKHFAPPSYSWQHLGRCDLQLPSWLRCIDASDRVVRKDDGCDLGEEP